MTLFKKRQRLLDTDSDDDDSSSDECFRRSDGDDFETESDLDEEAMAQKTACKARFNTMYAAFRVSCFFVLFNVETDEKLGIY